MPKFRGLSSKEKAAHIGMCFLYPLMILFSWLGKSLKLFCAMKKQMIAGVLSVAMVFTMLPMSAFAMGNNVLPGDVNSDGKVNMKDVLVLKKHLAGQKVDIDFIAADVNVDGTVNTTDLQLIKKYLAGWKIKLGEGMCVITFDADGGTAVEPLSVKIGSKLKDVPKTQKDEYTFLGWYTEDGQPFYAEDEVVTDLSLVAKYEAMPSKETLSLTTFTQMNQTPDLSFTVIGDKDLTVQQVKDMLTLEMIDGSDPVALTVKKNDDGTYSIFADEGFNEGCSYNLVIAEGLCFKDKEDSIRNASFTIDKEEVAQLKFKDDLTYIQDTDSMTYKLSTGAVVDVLDFALIDNNTSEPLTGTFSYNGALQVGQTICIYEKIKPTERDMLNEAQYADDSVAFIEITSISGSTVSFRSLDEDDAMDVLFMPDTLPYQVSAVPTGKTGTIDGPGYDKDAWSYMGKKDVPQFDVGDFVVFYTGDFAALGDNSLVYYGEVTEINETTLTYKKTTPEAMQNAMDVFTTTPVSGDQLLEKIDQEALVSEVKAQMKQSGFAEDSARYFATAALNTDKVKKIPGLEKMSLTKADGTPLTAKQMRAIGAQIELSDDVTLTVELDKSSAYFKDGVRLAVGIAAEFSVDVGEGEMKILLNATFVEEIALDVNIKAKAHVTWYFIIPVIDEIGMNANVDVKNYSAISLDLRIYTLESNDLQIAEDWDEFKDLKETFDKIEELKEKIEQAKDTIDKIKGYKEDLEALLDTVTGEDEVTFEKLVETFGEMNITDDLMGLLNLTNEAELDAGVKDLMEQYCEILEQECGWVELLRQEIFHGGYKFYQIIAIEMHMDFIISGKVNIALGANMEYVVGKRYSFWFEIISKTAGSSQMDILDERFAFQFYVMGALGMRMGIEFEIAVGIYDTKYNSVGITAEFGPYVMIYGYFIYEYSQLRPANSNAWQYDEKMMGAMYLDFGLYVEVTFKAQIGNGKLKYEPTLFEEEYPLLNAGTRRNVYDFGYTVEDDEFLRIIDDDGNGSNGYSMTLPDSYKTMSYVDLQEGILGKAQYPTDKFYYAVSNRHFSVDDKTGKITVNVPSGVSYMECDLTLTWKMDKLAYRSQDIAQTIHLVWTNLSTDELKEPFTSSVKVGNEKDGYTTVWSKRIIKNKEFDLPTQEEILKLLNYDSYNLLGFGNMKYSHVDGYSSKEIAGLKINRDTDYYFEVTPRVYTMLVTGVKNADGSTKNQEFTARFGEKFNLSSLAKTGESNDSTKTYTTYFNTTAEQDGKALTRNVNEEISRLFAQELINFGTVYTANYVDNSVSVVYKFVGADLEEQTIKIKKGTIPPETYINDLILQGKMVKSISPALGTVNTATTFTIYCEQTNAPKHTISYHTNGGNAIATGTYFEGSAISAPNAPTKEGYVFDGWYRDEILTIPFTFETMPREDITLYAKWKGEQYTVSFDAREGTIDGENTKTVVYSEKYGNLPGVTRPGYVFDGWFTAQTGGTLVTGESVYTTVGNQTLYARWTAKQFINKSDVTIENATATYDQKVHGVTYLHSTLNDFTVKYKRQNTDKWENNAIFAGTYDVRVTRAEDAAYQSFDETYIGVLTIDKAVRTIDADSIVINSTSFTTMDLSINIPDNRGTVYFYTRVNPIQKPSNETAYDKRNNKVVLKNLAIEQQYYVDVAVKDDLNYDNVISEKPKLISTKKKPTTSWNDYADTSWYRSDNTYMIIDSAEQLAGLAKLTNGGVTFEGKTVDIRIMNIYWKNEINLDAHKWIPIGNKESNPFKGTIQCSTGTLIRGMYCENTTGIGGFVGVLDGGNMNGVTITDSYVASGTLETGSSIMTGGIVGYGKNSSILRCVNDAHVVAHPSDSMSGGVVGYAIDTDITYCQNNGDVEGIWAGGITSYFYSKNHVRIDGCRNTGTIKGNSYVGGIAGISDSGNGYIGIMNCVNEGSISGKNYVAGICGENESGNIVNSANRGSVTGSNEIGGIVGTNNGETSRIFNCYSTGWVVGSNYVGAIVGRNNKNNGEVLHCYYLQGSATDNGSPVNGAGKDGGTVEDDRDNRNMAYFTASDSKLSRDTGYGVKDLFSALNGWVAGKYTGVEYWIQGKDGYPELAKTGKSTRSYSLQTFNTWKKQPEELVAASNNTEDEK